MTGRTAAEAVRAATRRLSDAGIPNPLWEARHLLCDAEGLTAEDLLLAPDRLLRDAARYEDWIARRASGEPMARISGRRSFRGLDFAVSRETLDPRPDSEALVEATLDLLPQAACARIADLGTGSGCLLLALLWERPGCRGLGLDLSEGALRTARFNAQRLGLAERVCFVRGSWAAALRTGGIDLLIANPPYIRRDEIPELPREVREFDPPLALDGGADGLDAYRAILADASRCLRADGVLALEIGWDQGTAVCALAEQAEFENVSLHRDLGGRDRVVTARNAT